MNTKNVRKIFIGTTIGLTGLIAAYFWYAQYQLQLAETALSSESILSDVQSKAEVPLDETPYISVLKPESPYQKKGFFLLAEYGDRILVYPQNKVAVLYRPSNRKVISMTTLDSHQWNNVFLSKEQQLTVDTEGVFRRSTDPLVVTVVSQMADIKRRQQLIQRVRENYPTLVVEEKNREQIVGYPTTLVADLSAENGDLVDSLAEFIGGKVVDQSPPGEITPATDILILLGQDP